MNGPIAYLRIALSLILVLLAVSCGDAIAVQIEPNPNPFNNSISVTPGTIGENLTPFSNLGAIDIHVDGTLRNADRLDNSGTISNRGTFINEGLVGNQGLFTNAGQVRFGEGTVFRNTLGDAQSAYIQQASGRTQTKAPS